MSHVILKGRTDGYELTLSPAGDFDVIMTELEALLEQLRQNATPTQQTLKVFTQTRLLDEEQIARIKTLLTHYSFFELEQVSADVMTIDDAIAWKERESVHTVVQVIRSGQEVNVIGDVLFLGKIHTGGTLKATGNIFVQGEVEGILHAGFGGQDEAIIVGNFQKANQLRIGDHVEIMENTSFDFVPGEMYFACVNDLHIVDYNLLNQLKTMKPKIYNTLGGL